MALWGSALAAGRFFCHRSKQFSLGASMILGWCGADACPEAKTPEALGQRITARPEHVLFLAG